MNTQQNIHYALMCLQALGAAGGRPQTARAISHQQGIPMAECRDLLNRLRQADLIQEEGQDAFVLAQPLDEIQAADVVTAANTPARVERTFALWFGMDRPFSVRKTFEALRWSQGLGVELAG